jgi:hypothetical protein
MELFRNIRLKIGKANLAKRLARTKRDVIYSNMDQVKNIGIVWDASLTSDFTYLTRFYQKMNDKNISVKIHCYYPAKDLPDQYTAIRYLTCLRKNELNLFYNPVSTESVSFISNPFDVLIDINFNNLFPLNYISTLSRAKFKVGLFDTETPDAPFDLMMEIKKPVNIEDYLNNVVNYLEMINSGTRKKDKN